MARKFSSQPEAVCLVNVLLSFRCMQHCIFDFSQTFSGKQMLLP